LSVQIELRNAPRRHAGRRPPAEPSRQIGRRLRHLRLARGLTLADVATALGMSKTNWVHYESGRNRLSLDQIPDIARALGIAPNRLLEQLSASWLSPTESSNAGDGDIEAELSRIATGYRFLANADRVHVNQAVTAVAALTIRLAGARGLRDGMS
jgi:transcriptional regulator with XRE-family HTH domain